MNQIIVFGNSILYFELTFVYGMRYGFRFTLLHMAVHSFIEEAILSPLHILGEPL